jgi:hypothetical protein
MGWIWRWVWKLLRVRLLVPLLAIAAAGEFWLSVRPKPCPLDERRVRLADEVAAKLAESLPVPQVGRPSIIVLPFERDPTGSITEAVRRAVERVDRYAVEPASLWENTCRKIGFDLAPVSVDRVESLPASGIPAEYLLAGRVVTLSARSDMDEANLDAVFIPVGVTNLDVGEPKPVTAVSEQAIGGRPLGEPNHLLRLRAEAAHDHRAEAGSTAAGLFARPDRLLFWLLTALLIPLIFASLITRGLARESNGLNLAMLLGLTVLAGTAAWALLELDPKTGSGATLLALTVAIGLAYNWCILSKLEELRN